MSALAASLPRPKLSYDNSKSSTPVVPTTTAIATTGSSFVPPAYGNRKGFIPRKKEDFGDGGAFPEIHVAQYPLDMGRKTQSRRSVVTKTLDSDGNVKYDAILGHGPNGQTVHSTSQALVPKDVTKEDLSRPSQEEEAEVTAATKAAIEKRIAGKIKAARPTQIPEQRGGATYIRYTPSGSQTGRNFNSGAAQRIIRMVEMPKDPMEPPKFKHKRVPGGPPDAPVPILHSPPKKLSMADQQAWKIPACISNWKNSKGYTIPLDKRLAADGRGLQEVQINDNFAKISEALYIAERRAREEVAHRAAIEKKIAENTELHRQEMLHKLAADARRTRSEIANTTMDEEEARRKEDRDELRAERKRERERKRRLDAYKGTKRLRKDEDRDVSERIALGLKAAPSKESMYDQRLFNQDQGMNSGFEADDAYNVYSEPLFKGTAVSKSIYRPRVGDDEVYGSEKDLEALKNTSRFKADKGFAGKEGGSSASSNKSSRSGRDEPVQFERLQEEDPFGLDEFLSDQKEGSRKPLDAIGRGTMHAGAAGAASYEQYKEGGAGSGRSEISFQSGGVRTDSDRRRDRRASERQRDDGGERRGRRR